MQLNFVKPSVDVISSYKTFSNESIFFEGPISDQYIFIKTNEIGYEKIRLIAEECVDGVHFIAVHSSAMEYIVAIPRDLLAYFASEALSYDMLTYLESEGFESKFPHVFYDILFASNIEFDKTLLNEHLMAGKAFIETNLDDEIYEIKTADELCAMNPMLEIYTHMIAIRVTGTENTIRKFSTVWNDGDIYDTLSAKHFLRPYSCFISDYFARDYSLVNKNIENQVFQDWCKIVESQYALVAKASGDVMETDSRIYPETHAQQHSCIVNLSLIIHYIENAINFKSFSDYYTVAIAYEMIKILRNYKNCNIVDDFLNKYVYEINHAEERIQTYNEMYNQHTQYKNR